MSEVEYLIYQYLLEADIDKPKRLLYKDIRDRLDLERVEYDTELIDILIEMCIDKWKR